MTEFQWLFGEKGVTVGPSTEGFSFRATMPAAAQLLAEPPWESYRLEAEVRQEAARMGTAGVFFGGVSYPADSGPCHLLCGLGIAERGLLSGQLFLTVSRTPDDNPAVSKSSILFRDHPFNGVDEPGAPAPWRQLAVEVTRKDVTLFFQGRHLRTVPSEEVCRGSALLFNNPGDPGWTSVPRGGIGLYVDKDVEATFRRVIMRRLDNDE